MVRSTSKMKLLAAFVLVQYGFTQAQAALLMEIARPTLTWRLSVLNERDLRVLRAEILSLYAARAREQSTQQRSPLPPQVEAATEQPPRSATEQSPRPACRPVEPEASYKRMYDELLLQNESLLQQLQELRQRLNGPHEEEEMKDGVDDREEAKQDDEEQNETSNEFEGASSEVSFANGELREDDLFFCAERLSDVDPDEINPDDHSTSDDPVVTSGTLPDAAPPNVSSIDSYYFTIEFPKRPVCPYYEEFGRCLFPSGIPCSGSHGKCLPSKFYLGFCTILSHHLISRTTALQTSM